MQRGLINGIKQLFIPPSLGGGDSANDGALLGFDSTQPGGVKPVPVGTYVVQVTGLSASSDNTATILAAANALPSGGIVQLPAGVWPVNLAGANALPAGVILRGAGMVLPGSGNKGTQLQPAGAGQTYVVQLSNPETGLDELTVNALVHTAANTATKALSCSGNRPCLGKVCVLGGSTTTFETTSAAAQGFAEFLFVQTLDVTTGGVAPVVHAGIDWLIDAVMVNGPGTSTLSGGGTQWGTSYWQGSSGSAVGTGAIIKDLGGQQFGTVYLDSPVGTAVVDRTGATLSSTYGSVVLVQSLTAVSGFPVFKETATAGAGVVILSIIDQGGLAAGSSCTYLVQGPIASTSVGPRNIAAGWHNTGWYDTFGGKWDLIPPIALPYNGSHWADAGGGNEAGRYWSDRGVVHVQGQLTTDGTTTTAATLPAGFRPTATLSGIAVMYPGAFPLVLCFWQITAAGVLTIATAANGIPAAGSNAYLDFSFVVTT